MNYVRTDGPQAKIKDFFLSHKERSYSSNEISKALGIEYRLIHATLARLWRADFVERQSHKRLLRYRLAEGAQKKHQEKKQAHVEKGKLGETHLEVLNFFYSHREQSFSSTEVANVIDMTRGHISGLMLDMFRIGLLQKIYGVYPNRYKIADDDRVPALLAKCDEKPEEVPLSPFWIGMAVWDSAVKAAVRAKG